MVATRVGLFVVTVVGLLAGLAVLATLMASHWGAAVGSVILLLLCVSGVRNLRGRMHRLRT